MTQPLIYPAGQKQISPLTGAEQVEIDGGGAVKAFATTQQIANLASLETTNQVITALNTAGAGTITAAGIVGGITARGGAQSATAFTDITDTAAAIIALLPAAAPVGTTFEWNYENTTNANATLTSGNNVTLAGNVIVPKLTTAKYLVKVTSATAVSITFFSAGLVVPLPVSQYYSETGTNNATLNVAGLTGAQICNITLAGTAPNNLALPPATQITAAIPNAQPGLTYLINIENPSVVTAQLTGLTGTSITGTAKIQTLTARQYQATVDSLSSFSLQGLTSTTL